ncbi:MAG: GH32 C-terminal domain-containing protein, partial [Oscillospiraceae bacterium]|nr:GH32 C-terminal domain-containing protein [Oscillospiraceae bacterium]
DNMGWMWECPDYFETDGKGVVVFSPMGFLKDEKPYDSVAICALADFNEETGEMNISDSWQLLDCGEDLYAPQSNVDKDGNRVVIAWARMPEPFEKNRSGIYCIPRVVEVRNNHIYFRPHPNAVKLFTRKISSPTEAGEGGYKFSLDLKNGEEINIGGYKLSRNNDRIKADRSNVFAGHNEIKCVFETPEIKEGDHLDIYVDKNLIEVYINNGEYVLTNTVYGLSDEIIAENYEMYAVSE